MTIYDLAEKLFPKISQFEKGFFDLEALEDFIAETYNKPEYQNIENMLVFNLATGEEVFNRLTKTSVPARELEIWEDDYFEKVCEDYSIDDLRSAFFKLPVSSRASDFVVKLRHERVEAIQSEQDLKDDYNRKATENMRRGR